jgi:hypothetical protein
MACKKRILPRLSLPLIVVLFTVGCGAQTGAKACNIPVFKNALEHWMAESYELFIFYKGPSKPDAKEISVRLNAASESNEELNINVRWVDVSDAISDSAVAALWSGQKDAAPRAVLCYPACLQPVRAKAQVQTLPAFERPGGCTPTKLDSDQMYQSVWSGECNSSELCGLIASPSRREAMKLLKGGESAVWLFVGCGDPQKDLPARESLEAQLHAAEMDLTLPDSESALMVGSAESRITNASHPHFSIVSVDRELAFEQGLIRILENAFELPSGRGPLAFPVFGRGRVFGALTEEAISSQSAIGAACKTLCGCCSCRIKVNRPGFDLLLSANWGEDDKALSTPANEQPIRAIKTAIDAAPALSELASAAKPNSAKELNLSTTIVAAVTCLIVLAGIALRALSVNREKRDPYEGRHQ